MKYFIANWKMYLGPEKSRALAAQYAGLSIPATVTTIVCPTALSLCGVAEQLKNTPWQIGAQTLAWTPEGAYTGAVSAHFFAEAGATYTLVGHSERRHIFGETDPETRKKIEAALLVNIKPILCIGETQEDLQNGKRQYRLKKQLFSALDNLAEAEKVIIAYEPVWAIHTSPDSVPCLPADVVDVHGWIANEVAQFGLSEPTILYGGSISAANCAAYAALPNVSGFLVGNAALRAGEVTSILAALDN